MGAGDWVSGGLRRAVSGVRSALPGQGEAEPAQEPATSAAVTSDQGNPDDGDAEADRGAAHADRAGGEGDREEGARKEGDPQEGDPDEGCDEAGPRGDCRHAPRGGDTDRGHAAPPPPVAPAPAVPTWTDEELAGFRVALETDIIRLREELHMGEADMADLLADSSDGAGDDQADAGSKTLEREQEMSVNANARDLLDQSTHALRRLAAGTYGICESCGTVIPAARLRAFPRATLCIACKQAEERR